MGRWGQPLLGGVLLGGFAILLVTYPSQSAESARAGLTLCLNLIIPSLFPFFVLSSLMISTGLAEILARPLERPMKLLFGVGSQGAVLLVLGAIGGYPAGARALAQMTHQGSLSSQEARHLSLFCNNCGPAFFLGVVGGQLFSSREVGFLLWGTHLLAALVIGLVCRTSHPSTPRKPLPPASLSAQLPEAVTGAFQASLNVCGYVVLFSVLTGLLTSARVLPEQPWFRCLTMGLVELSTGITALGEVADASAALPLAAFLLGWGGCSVHCQTLPFLRELGLDPRPYLLAKCCQGLLAAGLTILFCQFLPLSLPVMAPAFPLSSPSLLGQELTVLWGLAGCYHILSRKKGGKKSEHPL